MKFLRAFTIPLLVLAALIVSACNSAAPATPAAQPDTSDAPTEEVVAEPGDIVDIAGADDRFETLVAALTAADLVETLQGEGPFTVFAPTDEAFEALPEGTLDALLQDQAALTDVLLYHVVPGEVMAADVAALEAAETVQGQSVALTAEGEAVMVNEAQVVVADIEAANGVIHVIDAVLLPPFEEAAMAEEEMAQTDEAAMEEEEAAQTIVDLAAADDRFETLVAVLTEVDLVETLRSEGPFTVFAPTDEAFEALPEGTLDTLLQDESALTNVLLYHVVPGEVMAADVVTLETAETVQGQSITFAAEGEAVMVNEAQVVVADIEAANGVIHVIDAVLLPPAE